VPKFWQIRLAQSETERRTGNISSFSDQNIAMNIILTLIDNDIPNKMIY
jgi:hypothetical protein